MKKCSMCGCKKPLSEFHKAKKHPDGLDYRCKSCCKDYKKEYREANKDLYYKRTEKYRENNRERFLLYAAKNRAKDKGLPFDITIEDIIIPDVCPVLGIPLKFNKDKMEDDSPSIDKLVPDIGYVKGNISIMSVRANRLKCDASSEELYKVANWIKENIE